MGSVTAEKKNNNDKTIRKHKLQLEHANLNTKVVMKRLEYVGSGAIVRTRC